MAHSNHEREILDILSKSFKSLFVVNSWDFMGKYCAASNLDRQIFPFIFAMLCLGPIVVFHKNVS